jgi:hypothetical protein
MGAHRSNRNRNRNRTEVITIPCAPIASVGNENLYLLDENKNLVFYNKPNMMSLDLEHLIDSFKKRIKPERYENIYDIGTSIIDNCELKKVTFLNLGQIPDVFLPSEIIINGDILNQYNLSDVDLTIFEKTELFDNYIETQDLQTYKKLNDKDKKRLVFLLYINYIEEDLLTRLVNTNNIKFNFTEDDNLRHTYLNPSIIEYSIKVLTEFKDVFIIKIPKKEAVKKIIPQIVIPQTVIPQTVEPPKVEPPKVEPPKEEPQKEEPKKEDITGIIVGSVIGGLAFIIIVICLWWKFVRKPAKVPVPVAAPAQKVGVTAAKKR